MRTRSATALLASVAIAALGGLVGYHYGQHDTAGFGEANAAETSTPTPQAARYSRTGAVKDRTVYYPGTEDLAPDEMRVGVYNHYVYPVPPLEEKQITASGDRYQTPLWVVKGLEPELLPVIQKIYDDFNDERGTDFNNPLAK